MSGSQSVSTLLGRLNFLLNSCAHLLFVTFLMALVLPPYGMLGILMVLLPLGAIVCWRLSRKVLNDTFQAAYRQAPALLRRPSLVKLRQDTLARWTVFIVAGTFMAYGLFGIVLPLLPVKQVDGMPHLGQTMIVVAITLLLRGLTLASVLGIFYLLYRQRSLKNAIQELEMLNMMQDAPVPASRRRHMSAYCDETVARPSPALRPSPSLATAPSAPEAAPENDPGADLKTIANVGSENLLTFLVEHYRTERGAHAETVIGATAALSADFAVRGTAVELPDRNSWILSPGANRLLYAGQEDGEATVWSIVRQGAIRAGADPQALPDLEDTVRRVADAVGGSPFPPLSIPAEHYPHEWSPNAGPRLRDDVARIAAQAGLTTADTALALGFTLAELMEYTNEALPPAISATLALEVLVGAARMAPLQRIIE